MGDGPGDLPRGAVRDWRGRCLNRLDPRRLRCWGLLALLIVLGSAPVQAAPASTVVLVRMPAGEHGRWRAAEDRTRDELRVMGMGVVEVELREDRADIERAMAEHGAFVAVLVERERDVGAAEIQWLDPGDGERRAVRIEGLATDGRAAAIVAALRAAELVHTQMQSRGEHREEAGVKDRSPSAGIQSAATTATRTGREADIEARPEAGVRDRSPALSAEGAGVAAAGDGPTQSGVATVTVAPVWSDVIDPLDFVVAAPPPPKPQPRDPGASGDLALGVYAGVGGGPGGAGPLIGGGLALRWHVLHNLAIQGEAQGAISPVWLSGQGQSFRVGLAGARAALVFVARRDARVSWRLGLGGGATLAWALARSKDPVRSSQDRIVVGLLRASVHLAIRVRAHLRLVIGLDVDLLVPPVAVQVLGAEVARVGTPLVRGVLGLEWDWWSRARR